MESLLLTAQAQNHAWPREKTHSKMQNPQIVLCIRVLVKVTQKLQNIRNPYSTSGKFHSWAL